MRRSIGLVLWLLLVCGFVDAEGVDSEFTDAAPDQVADPSQGLTVDQLVQKNVRLYENMTAEGYYIGGWSDLTGRWENTPYNALVFGFGTDARLDKNIRAFASFQMTYPTTTSSSDDLYNSYGSSFPDSDPTLEFSNITVEELFLDYTLGDSLFLRIGRESVSWGQGRIFNPTNYIGAMKEGIGAKTAFDLAGWTFTAAAMKNDDYYKIDSDTTTLVGVETLGMAAKFEGTLGAFSLGVSGFHHANVGDKGSAYVKTSLLGFDLFTEGLVERKRTSNVYSGDPVPSVLVGLFREWGTGKPWLQLQVEYLVSGRNGSSSAMVIPAEFTDLTDQSIGVGATSNVFSFLKTKPTLAWLHSLQDQSGQLVFALANTALPHIDLTAGLLWIYGPDTGRYVVNNPDDDAYGRQLMLTLKASFALDIEN